jgi:hypothetical protein
LTLPLLHNVLLSNQFQHPTVQDTRTPLLLNAIYEQITHCAAGYGNLVDGGDISYDYVKDQVTMDGSLRYPDLAHDKIPEGYRLRLQNPP